MEPGRNGQLRFRPEKVWLGKALAPTAVTKEIAQAITEAFAGGDLQLPGHIRSLRIEEGRLVIEGTTSG